MSDRHHEKALATRREFAARSEAMGITKDFVDRLVETFYAHIRAHEILGPIFERKLTGRWPAHLAKMKTFWRSIAFMSGEFHGKPMQAHAVLADLQPWHFGLWLSLFDETLREIAPTHEAADFFNQRAERIAESLMLGLFYRPEQAGKEAVR
jgi:hemoglobin